MLIQQKSVKMSSYKKFFKNNSYSPNSESEGCSWNCKKKSEIDDTNKNCQAQSYQSYKDDDSKSTSTSSTVYSGYAYVYFGLPKK